MANTDASLTIYRQVRAALVARGDSLNAWCQRNGVTRQWAERVLQGKDGGPAARKLLTRILRSSGVNAA